MQDGGDQGGRVGIGGVEEGLDEALGKAVDKGDKEEDEGRVRKGDAKVLGGRVSGDSIWRSETKDIQQFSKPSRLRKKDACRMQGERKGLRHGLK